MTVIPCQLCAQQEQPSFVDQKTFDAEIKKLNDNIKALKQALEVQNKSTANIDKKLVDTHKKLSETDSETKKRVNDVSQSASDAQSRITGLGQQLGQRTVQLSFGTILAGILGIAALLFAFVIRKRNAEGSASLENKLSQVRVHIDDETVKLDGKLIELLQNQMQLFQAERSTKSLQEKPQALPAVDHSLPLKVGEEIFRMRQRLHALPPDTKGLKPLQKSLERLEEEFNQQGYEMINMHGLKYDEGMSVKAKFIASDELEIGQAIITKVIKPQVNYNSISIQDAEIEVSTGG